MYKEFVQEFLKAIDGDSFTSSGDDYKDMFGIQSVIDYQGFWSGVKYRYYFDEKLMKKGIVKLTRVEERKFGGA